MSLSGDFGCNDGVHHTVVAVTDAFFQLEQALFDVLLVWNVTAFSAFAEIAVFTHPLEQAVLSDVHSVLGDQLCQFSYQAARVARDDGIRKGHFGGLLLDLGVLG